MFGAEEENLLDSRLEMTPQLWYLGLQVGKEQEVCVFPDDLDFNRL